MTVLTRRSALAGLVGSAAFVRAAPLLAGSPVVRVGYQPYGTLMLLKASGDLEAALKPLGWSVEWKRFISGPPLMEALGAGAIDYGAAGETPPIFAQAAKAQFVYRGAEPPSPRGEGIIVHSDSPIRTLADLKGRKIAFNRGSNVHYLVLKALQSAGLTIKDVEIIYLAPTDGRAAFERGSVDAWSAWDPYLAAAQAAGRTRLLADGTGLVANTQFYVARRDFKDAAVLHAIEGAITKNDAATQADTASAAATLRPEIGLPIDVIKTALSRQTWAYRPMGPDLVAAQQEIADRFLQLGLIPRAVRISDALPVV